MAKNKRRIFQLKPWIAIAWLVFVVSLSVWWVVFFEQFMSEIVQLNVKLVDDIDRKRTMILWEGIFLIGSLIAGGIPFVMLLRRETEQSEKIRNFFSAFNHELKTSLASLRLQAEVLREGNRDDNDQVLDRLIDETSRLELQLENSLVVGEGQLPHVLIEEVNMRSMLSQLRRQYPQVEIDFVGEPVIKGDERALKGILRNVLQNSIVHGSAKRIVIEVSEKASISELSIRDDGPGFSGEVNLLAQPYLRHATTSGSGLGLSIVQTFARAMGGEAQFKNAQSGGFEVCILLPGRSL